MTPATGSATATMTVPPPTTTRDTNTINPSLPTTTNSTKEAHQQRIEPFPLQPTDNPLPYPRWITHKFTPAGITLPFPGNTILSHLSQTTTLHKQLTNLHTILSQSPFSSILALLPPSSYHTTLYEGVSYHIPSPNQWPPSLPLTASLAEVHGAVLSALAPLVTSLPTQLQAPYRFRIVGWEPLTDGIALKLVPATEAEERKLRQLREVFADAVGIRHPGFGEYSFHMSVGYLLKWLRPEEEKGLRELLDEWLGTVNEREVVLGAGEVCVYDDMMAFRRVYYLDGNK